MHEVGWAIPQGALSVSAEVKLPLTFWVIFSLTLNAHASEACSKSEGHVLRRAMSGFLSFEG